MSDKECTPYWTYRGGLFYCGCGHIHTVRDVNDADTAHANHRGQAQR